MRIAIDNFRGEIPRGCGSRSPSSARVVHTVSYPVTITAADAGVAPGSIQVLMLTENALIDELNS